MKKFAAILLGLMFIGTSTGCYYGWPFRYGYYHGGNNFGGPGSNCGVPQGSFNPQFNPQPGALTPPPTVSPQSGFYQPYHSFQTAMPPVLAPPVTAFGPTMFQANPYRTATGPMESLPTY